MAAARARQRLVWLALLAVLLAAALVVAVIGLTHQPAGLPASLVSPISPAPANTDAADRALYGAAATGTAKVSYLFPG